MRRVDVDRMMASMTALEYKEWEAYERATGPLDQSYERELLAQLLELTQIGNLIAGRPQKRGGKNAAGKFRKIVRAEQIHLPPEGEDEDPDDEDDEYYEIDEGERDARGLSSSGYDPAKDPFAPK